MARKNFDPGRSREAHSTQPNKPVGTGGPFGEAGPCGGQPPLDPVIPTGGGSSPPARKPPAGRLLAERLSTNQIENQWSGRDAMEKIRA